jgi:hypothetical protein
VLNFGGSYQQAVANPGPGPYPTRTFEFFGVGAAVGYDWTLLRAKSAMGVDIYIPLALEFNSAWIMADDQYHSPNFNAMAGLGLRWRISQIFALNLSGRYHLHLAGETFELPDGSIFKNGDYQVESDMSGLELRFGIGLYLW